MSDNLLMYAAYFGCIVFVVLWLAFLAWHATKVFSAERRAVEAMDDEAKVVSTGDVGRPIVGFVIHCIVFAFALVMLFQARNQLFGTSESMDSQVIHERDEQVRKNVERTELTDAKTITEQRRQRMEAQKQKEFEDRRKRAEQDRKRSDEYLKKLMENN